MPSNVKPDWPRPERPEGDRRKLHALIKVRLKYERMYAVRLVFVYVLAVIGGGVWLELNQTT